MSQSSSELSSAAAAAAAAFPPVHHNFVGQFNFGDARPKQEPMPPHKVGLQLREKCKVTLATIWVCHVQ